MKFAGILAAGLVASLPVSAGAALVEIRYSGKIDYLSDLAGVVDDSVRLGDRMWISLIHDLDAPAPVVSGFPQEKRREGSGAVSPLLSYSVGSGIWQTGETAVSSRVWTYQRATCCLDGYGGEVIGSRGRVTANLTSQADILPFDFATPINMTVPVTSEAYFFFNGFQTGVGIDIDSFSVTPLTAVPEPGSWMMLLTGFAMIGSAVRYRRRHIKIAYA